MRFGATAWSQDSKTVYFNRLRQMQPGDPGTDTPRNSTLYGWNLQDKPVALLGTSAGRGPAFAPEEFPVLGITPGTPEALALSMNGVQNEWKAWIAPATDVANPKTVAGSPWLT
ncbi:hypothetical protein, partial [Rhodanobacter lindaniclasticus]